MKFSYHAKNAQGGKVSGVTEAPDERSVAVYLREQKLIPVSIKKGANGINLNELFSGLNRVSSAEITNFTRQLSTMITAGLPLTDALNLLKVQSSNTLSPIVGALLTDVQGGVSLSEAMSHHPQAFPKVYIALVKAGEAAGVMETILNRLADSMEKSREFTAQVKGAMVYPVIVIIGMIGVMILMMVAVVPKLTVLYSQFDQQLPLATQLVVGTSNFMINFWWLIIIVGVASFWGLRSYIEKPVGRQNWDTFKYKLPVLGKLFTQIMLTEMSRTLSLLIGAGVSVVDGLNIVSEALGSINVENELKKIARQVEKGFPVSVCFSESTNFPPIVGQMIAVGEETGKMDDVLNKLSRFYESEAEQRVKGLTTAMEPIILVVMGVGIGFLIYAIIMPIYGITNNL